MALHETAPKLNLDKRIVTFIGPEGSGKTKQAKRLARDTKKPYISTGDIIRNLSKNDPGKVGDECRVVFRDKVYLNPDTLLKILFDRYIQDDMAGGFIVDGGLRTVKETEDYPEFLKQVGRNFPMTVVHLCIPGWKGLDRLVFEVDARNREDDTEEGVLSRLSKYYDQLGTRVSLIRQQPNWNLIHVNAMGTKDETYQRLCAALSQ